MCEIDFELHVEAPGRSPDEFMDYVDDTLYESYKGDLSPIVRSPSFFISGTTETGNRNYTEAVMPISRELRDLGIYVVGFEVVRSMELA